MHQFSFLRKRSADRERNADVFRVALLLSAVCGCGNAAAQSVPTAEAAVEEIVVTADWRRNPLQALGTSASVFTAADIEQRAAEHLGDLFGAAANLNFSQGSSRPRYFQIRGIGERSQFAEPLNPSVGLLIDGVDFSGIGTAATLFDVDHVEILRGPQGTRFGANALAGLINLTTLAPSTTPEYRVSGEVGNYASYHLGAVASGPISAVLGYRVALQQSLSDGFIRNRIKGDDTSDRDEFTGRARLRFAPNDDVILDWTVGRVSVDNGYDDFSLDNNRRPSSDQPGKDIQRTNYSSLNLSWSINELMSLNATVGGDQTDVDYRYDEDWTYSGFDPNGYSSTDVYLRNRDSQSLDVRLSSNAEGRLFASSTDWLFGVYAIGDETRLERVYTFFDAPFFSRTKNRRFAYYGQFDSELTDRWTFSLGGRVEQRRGRYADSDALRFRPNETLWGGNATLSFHFDDDQLLYVSIARGYKAGGFNIKGTLPADLREFDSETLLSYELGAKGDLFDGRGQYRLAAFTMRREDMQVATSIQRPIDASDPTGPVEFIDFIGNAASGSNSGLELEANAWLNDKIEASLALGLLRTRYDHFTNSTGESLDGRDQAQSPRLTGHAALTYHFDAAWQATLEGEGKAAYYFDDSNDSRSKSYGLMHVRLEYANDDLRVALWAKNIFDVDYAVRGFFFGNDPRIDYAQRTYRQFGEPRRIGLTVSANL